MLLDKTVFVARLTRDGSDADKEAYTTFSGFVGPQQEATAAVKMNIQPASPQLTALTEGVVGKTYRAFTRSSGVVEQMQLTVSGTNERYMVQGREVYDYGVDTHYELILSKGER